MAMTTPLYEVRNASKHYGSVVALDDVSLAIAPGEVIGLVGDNGAGKSTLVKILSGAHEPTHGQIFLEGEERRWASPHEALEAGVETLYQDSGLAPHLSVSANVFLGREEYVKGSSESLAFWRRRRWISMRMRIWRELELPFRNQIARSLNSLAANVKPWRLGAPSLGRAR